jgi:hypothetical protein
MFRFTSIGMCVACMLGLSAATAPAVTTDTWALSEFAGHSSATYAGDVAEAEGSGAVLPGTGGLVFMRASSGPAWVLDAMFSSIPWTFGGPAVSHRAVAERAQRRHFGGGRRVFVARGTRADVRQETIDDYSDRWSDAQSSDYADEAGARSEVLSDRLEPTDWDGYRDHDPGDLLEPDERDDRSDDRYHDDR